MCDKVDHRTSNNVFNKLVNGIRECKWCHQKFENITGSILANHVRWCKENPNRGKGLKEKLQASKEIQMIETFGEYREFTIKCDNPKCSNYLVVVEREKKFPEKKHYFCCKHCSHSFSGGCVNPNNIKAGRKKFDEEHPGYWSKNGIINEKIIRNCLWCGIIFETNTIRNAKCCCHKHAAMYREYYDFILHLNASVNDYERMRLFYKRYRLLCNFKFSLKLFAHEFDFSLGNKYSIYKAKNHGDNLNGIARDHMYSVKDGFLNYIDPIFISHPANCQLIRQFENASKGKKSSIIKEELQQRIIEWDIRNGKYVEDMIYDDINKKFDWTNIQNIYDIVI